MTDRRIAVSHVAGIALAFWSTLWGTANATGPACPSGNLLAGDKIVESFGAIREQRLVDGRIPRPGAKVDDFVAALFVAPVAHVTFDLKTPTAIAAVQVVSDNNEPGLVSVSDDGVEFTELALPVAPRTSGVQSRYVRKLDVTARFIRIAPRDPTRGRAIAEVLAFCRTPASFPVQLEEQVPFMEDFQARRSRAFWVRIAKFGIALLVLAVLAAVPGATGRRRRNVGLCLIVIGALGWVRFGDLNGFGQVVHPWDAMHYYIGAKYFHELRYTELYRCIAAHERQMGRGYMVDRVQVRDLDDNVEHPGSWTSTPAGGCRAGFSRERWREFGADVDAFRRMFTHKHFHQVLHDHGYNATPVHTAWLQALLGSTGDPRASLKGLVSLDFVAYAVALGALWWGFGPIAAGIGAVVLGFGSPWAYYWTGGSIARAIWVACLCLGFAGLKKRYWFTGSALVTVSALLRFFPLVFVGALGVFVLGRTWRLRKVDPECRRILAGILVTMIAGLWAGAAANGPVVYPEFLENSRVHGTIPAGNHIGLGVLASYGLQDSVLRLTQDRDTLEGSSMMLCLRLLLWGLGAAAAVALLFRYASTNAESWQFVPLAAPLVFCSIPLGSYDYIWLLVLAPFAQDSKLRLALLIGFAAVTDLLAVVIDDALSLYAADSLLLLLVLTGFFAWVRGPDGEGYRRACR